MNNAVTSFEAGKSGMTRYRVLLGAIIVQLILGTVYGYSIFWEPLEAKVFPSIITAEKEQELALAGEDTSAYEIVADTAAAERLRDTQQGYLKYAFSICILTFALAMVMAGRVQDIKGPRFTAIIGAVLMGSGFLIAGLMNHAIVFYLAHATFTGAMGILVLMIYHALFGKLDKEKIPVLQYVPLGIIATVIIAGVLLGDQYVDSQGQIDKLFMLWGTIGFLAGGGIGFAYVCPLAALMKWFPEKKGLVSGLAVAGFGFGAYLFKDKVIGAVGFIESHDVTSFFVLHGVVCLVGITLGALLLSNPPSSGSAKIAVTDSNWQDTIRQPAFYVLWLMFFSGAMAGLMVIGILKGFAGEQLIAGASAGGKVVDESTRASLLLQGAEAVGWLAIFNAVGRIAWGFISDKIGRTAAFVAMFLCQATMMFLLAGMKTPLSLAIGASIVGFNFGGNFALFPSVTADLFGARNLGANYGWVFTSYGVAGVVGIAAGNAAKTTTGQYGTAFAAAGVLCLISAALAVYLKVIMARRAAKLAEPAA